MGVRDLVTASLQASGHGGLYCAGEPCGCVAPDLFPCGNDMEAIGEDCCPGYVHHCSTCPRTKDDCPVWDSDPKDPNGYCVGPRPGTPYARKDDDG